MKVKATKTINEDGAIYQPGQEFDLSPERAKRLTDLGMVEAVAGQKQEDADVGASGTPAKKGKAVRITESK